jgi:hypothetical protein
MAADDSLLLLPPMLLLPVRHWLLLLLLLLPPLLLRPHLCLGHLAAGCVQLRLKVSTHGLQCSTVLQAKREQQRVCRKNLSKAATQSLA